MKKCISIFLSFLLLSIASVVSAEPAIFSVAADGTSILEFEDYAAEFPIPLKQGKDANPDNLASGGNYVYNSSYKVDYVDFTIPLTVQESTYYDASLISTYGGWLSEIQIFADGSTTPFFTSLKSNRTALEQNGSLYYHKNASGGKDFPAIAYGFSLFFGKGSHTLTFRFLTREAFNNTVAFCVDAFSLTPAKSVSEPWILSLSGKTDNPDVKGATVMMVKKGTDRTKLTPSDVLYVDQTDIAEDGSYRIQLPFMSVDSYDLYTNMGSFDISDREKDSLYVSANGNDQNDGSKDAPFLTLAKAYESIGKYKRIVISGSVAYTDAPKPFSGTLHIAGSENAALVLPGEISLNGALTLENLNLSGEATIYANGKCFTVEDTVTSQNRLTVYGGKNNADLIGNTQLNLLGGKYLRIYGGGTGTVIGNTQVILGGNANNGDGIDDKASNISPCFVFGGGNGHPVTGTTHVTLKDNAVTQKIYGAGAANGAAQANITIKGGKVKTVFGCSYGATIDNCETNVTIEGGMAESVFGGSESQSMTNSHTRVYLAGGEVTRRVYSGCYNASLNDQTLETTHAVQGSTALIFFSGVRLNTKNELHVDNQYDIGVYAGSRLQAENANERNMVLYQNNCSAEYADVFGPKDNAGITAGTVHLPHYTVHTDNTHGTVSPSRAAGAIRIKTEKGYTAKVNNVYVTTEVVAIPTNATITFEKGYSIDSVNANPTETGAEAEVDVMINSVRTGVVPWILVAIYDDTNTLVDCRTLDIPNSSFSAYFEFECNLEPERSYLLKAMLWDENMQPLTAEYQVQLKK